MEDQVKDEMEDQRKPVGAFPVLTAVMTQSTIEGIMGNYNAKISQQVQDIKMRDDALQALNKQVRDLKKETEGLKIELSELKEKHPEIFQDLEDGGLLEQEAEEV